MKNYDEQGRIALVMKELKSIVENFDVISFDVFDTLLLRPYLTQEDLWLDLGRRELGEKNGAAFLKASQLVQT